MHESIRRSLIATVASVAAAAFSSLSSAQSGADVVIEVAASIGLSPESLVLADLEDSASTLLTAVDQEVGLIAAIGVLDLSVEYRF